MICCSGSQPRTTRVSKKKPPITPALIEAEAVKLLDDWFFNCSRGLVVSWLVVNRRSFGVRYSLLPRFNPSTLRRFNASRRRPQKCQITCSRKLSSPGSFLLTLSAIQSVPKTTLLIPEDTTRSLAKMFAAWRCRREKCCVQLFGH
jgi:hypothetical protein